jgi:hypothetical protein
MSRDNYNPIAKSNINRRNLLQTVGGIGGATALNLGAVGTATASGHCCPCLDGDEKDYSEIDDEDRLSDEDNKQENMDGNPYEYAMDNRYCVILGSSDKVGENQGWTHYFYTSSYYRSARRPGGSSDDWELYPNVSRHEMTLKNKRENESALEVIDDPYYIGASPSPNNSDSDLGQYGDAAYTALSLIMTRTNPQIATALTGAQLAYQLLDNSEEGEQSDKIRYAWDYQSNAEKCEAVNYCHFIVRTYEDHRKAEVRVWMNGNSSLATVGGDLSFDVYVDPYNSNDFESTDHGSSSISDMSEAEKRQYMEKSSDFKKIPHDEIEDDYKKELANGEAIYRALNPQVTIESKTHSE